MMILLRWICRPLFSRPQPRELWVAIGPGRRYAARLERGPTERETLEVVAR